MGETQIQNVEKKLTWKQFDLSSAYKWLLTTCMFFFHISRVHLILNQYFIKYKITDYYSM